MKKITLFLLFFFAISQTGVTQDVQPFDHGERVVFVGNSITHSGHYHSYIWLYYMTRFPSKRIDIFNAGIGGEVAGMMYKRLETDVFARNPTTIALTFGMNDTGYSEYLEPDAEQFAKERVAKSLENFLLIEKSLKDLAGVKKIIIASSPYDETAKIETPPFPDKYAAMLQIADYQEKKAKENSWGFVDYSRSMTEINQREQKQNPEFTLCGRDRIHPDANGHLVMAYLFLKEQGLSGYEVANIHIDAKGKGELKKSINSSVTNLSVTTNAVQFDYLSNSLPFPIDTTRRGWDVQKQSDALSVIPFIEEFNREMLQVEGLKESNEYVLRIDGIEIGQWFGSEFTTGINLARQTKTPQYQQALKVMQLNEKRWGIERTTRDYAWVQYDFFRAKGLLFADNETAVDTLKKYASDNPFLNLQFYQKARLKSTRDGWKEEMDNLVDEIYAINKPRKHRIEIELLK